MKHLLLLTFLFLSGCGFSPLYQKAKQDYQEIPVYVMPVPDTYGHSIRQTIIDKIGGVSDSSAKYTLTVQAPTFSSSDQSIDNRNFSSIIGLTIKCPYTLTKKSNKKVIAKSTASLFTSYAVVQDPYATTVAERKAKSELAKQVAEQITIHILSVLSEGK